MGGAQGTMNISVFGPKFDKEKTLSLIRQGTIRMNIHRQKKLTKAQ